MPASVFAQTHRFLSDFLAFLARDRQQHFVTLP